MGDARDRPLEQLALPEDLDHLGLDPLLGVLTERSNPLRGGLPRAAQTVEPPHPPTGDCSGDYGQR